VPVPPFPLFPFVAVAQRRHSPSLSCLPPPLSCLTSRILVQHVWPRIKSAFCSPTRLTVNDRKPNQACSSSWSCYCLAARALTSMHSRILGIMVRFPPHILGFLASWLVASRFCIFLRYCSRLPLRIESARALTSVSLHAFSDSWHCALLVLHFPLAIVLDSLSARALTTISLHAFSDSSCYCSRLSCRKSYYICFPPRVSDSWDRSLPLSVKKAHRDVGVCAPHCAPIITTAPQASTGSSPFAFS